MQDYPAFWSNKTSLHLNFLLKKTTRTTTCTGDFVVVVMTSLQMYNVNEIHRRLQRILEILYIINAKEVAFADVI